MEEIENDDSDYEEEDEEEKLKQLEAKAEELGEYGELFRDVIHFRRIEKENGTTEYKIDLEELFKETKKLLEGRAEFNEELKTLPSNRISTWIFEKQQADREMALHHKLALASVGMTSKDIGDVLDDSVHLLDDAVNPEGRELRKELKEKMGNLTRREKRELLESMLEDGHINEAQYRYLMSEFR